MRTFQIVLLLGTLVGLWDLLCHQNNEIRITTRSAPATPPLTITTQFLIETPPPTYKSAKKLTSNIPNDALSRC